MDITTESLRLGALFVHVSSERRKCGLAVVTPRARTGMEDGKSRQITLYEFIDTEQYANLESAMIQLSLQYVYVAEKCADAAELKKVQHVLEGVPELSVEFVSNSLFAEGDVLKHIQSVTGTSSYVFEKEDVAFARRAAAGLFNKCSELKSEGVADTAVAELGRLDNALRLDTAAVRALNLLPGARDAASLAANGMSGEGGAPMLSAPSTSSATSTSLFGLLSGRCKGKAGKKTVRAWLMQPLMDVDAITARQDVVEAFATHPTLLSSWQQGVSIPDLDSLCARLTGARANLHDLVKAYGFLIALPNIVNILKRGAAAAAEASGSGATMEEEGGEGGEGSAHAPTHPGLVILRDVYALPLEKHALDLARMRGLMDNVLEDPTDPHRPTVKRSFDPSLGRVGEELDEAEDGVQEVYDKAKR